MISDKALTGAMFACFIALPFSVALYLGAAMAAGGRSNGVMDLFAFGCMLLPPALVLGPVGGVVFKMLGWRRATWASVLSPAFVLVFIVIMTALSMSGVEEIP